MTRKNSFTEQTKFMFLDDNYWECAECGANHANCLHHIEGRGQAEGCEKSPLNAAPLNNFECHLALHGRHMTDQGKKKLFEWNLQFLERREYTLTDLDNQFLDKYSVEINRLKLKV